MEFLADTLIVVAVLIAVTIAALKYEPSNPYKPWIRLSAAYGTSDSPSEIQYTEQEISFGGFRGKLSPLDANARFDITLDDSSLWVTVRRVETGDIGSTLKIPGENVRFHAKNDNEFFFDLYAQPPIRIALQGEAGQAIYGKLNPDG